MVALGGAVGGSIPPIGAPPILLAAAAAKLLVFSDNFCKAFSNCLNVSSIDLNSYNPEFNVFLKNCPRFQTMQGPIEVISRQAALTVEAEIQTCHGVYGTGEDQYIVKCMEMLGISGQMEPTLLNDLYCDGYTNCNEPWKVAFHPHKKLLDFGTCYNMSLQASKLQPAR